MSQPDRMTEIRSAYTTRLQELEHQLNEARHARRQQQERADAEAASASKLIKALVSGAEIRGRVARTLRRMLGSCSDPRFVFGETLTDQAERLAAEMEDIKTPEQIEQEARDHNRPIFMEGVREH